MTEQELRTQVLDACHGLAASGMGDTVGGHVSVRVPGKDLYWTNVLDLSFEEMTEEDLLLLDFEGHVIDGNRPVSPGIDFHQLIYSMRPEINSVVHTHAHWMVTQSALGRPPRMWHNLSGYFFNKVAMSPDDTIEAISPVLGDNIAIIMPWHGSITLGKTVGEAAALHATLELVARLDVELMNSGADPMPDEGVARMQVLLGKANYLDHTWELMKRRAKRAGLPLAVDKAPNR